MNYLLECIPQRRWQTMNNYSPYGTGVVERWYHDNTLYCAFVDGTIVEYGSNQIEERFIEVWRSDLTETIQDLKSGRYDFDDYEPEEC